VAKILFILKQREVYYSGEDSYSCGGGYGLLTSGLFNSANFVCQMLKAEGYDSNIVHVVDNNSIDKEVTQYQPDIVIIEAFWVVPEKFDILQKLHPNVKWIIRNHSRLPFLANEGIAMQWIIAYAAYQNVYISSNANDTNEEIKEIIYTAYPNFTREMVDAKCPYLPNFYPIDEKHKRIDRIGRKSKLELDVGCFGAVRPLKNQLIQAVAAIKYANKVGKHLRFHINATRSEQQGDPVLKNIRQLFDGIHYELIEHEWMPHDQFLDVCAEMDIGLCCSYTETFCIVAADLVSQCVPVVGCDDIDWLSKEFRADPNDSDKIAEVMERAWIYGFLTPFYDFNRSNLKHYDNLSIACWDKEIRKLTW
jgi:glycosyltransferase involved in cell wall biosynthesis